MLTGTGRQIDILESWHNSSLCASGRCKPQGPTTAHDTMAWQEHCNSHIPTAWSIHRGPPDTTTDRWGNTTAGMPPPRRRSAATMALLRRGCKGSFGSWIRNASRCKGWHSNLAADTTSHTLATTWGGKGKLRKRCFRTFAKGPEITES